MSEQNSGKDINKVLDSKEGKKLAKTLANSIYRSLIAEGAIDPRGKTDQQIRSELSRYWQSNSPKIAITIAIDHTQMLLSEARTYARQGKSEFACLMYATWVEHWINGMIRYFGTKIWLAEKDLLEITRTSNSSQKLSWVWKLLQAPPINKSHLRVIERLIESRNRFVHYKWIAHDPDKEREEDQTPHPALKNIEKTIKYLSAYERRNIYYGKSKIP